MSELVCSIFQNPEEVDPNAGGGVDLLMRMRTSRQRERESFLLPCLSYRLPAEGVVHTKGGSDESGKPPQRSRLGVALHIPNDLCKKKKSLACVPSFLGFS